MCGGGGGGGGAPVWATQTGLTPTERLHVCTLVTACVRPNPGPIFLHNATDTLEPLFSTKAQACHAEDHLP